MHDYYLNELCKKEIICMPDGKKLGYPSDFTIDSCGKIQYIIVNERSGFSLFCGKNELRIPWCDVERICQDVIWVCGCFNGKENKYEKNN